MASSEAAVAWVRPVGLPDPFDHALGAAGLLVLGATLLPAAADEGQAVALRELFDPLWWPVALAALVTAGLALGALAIRTASPRRTRAALALAAIAGAALTLQANAEIAATLLPGPLAPLGRAGLAAAIAAASLGAVVLLRTSRARDGHATRGLALLSLACALLVVTPITVILAAGARTAAAAHADVHAVLGLRAGALVFAAILAGAGALDALLTRDDARTPGFSEDDDDPTHRARLFARLAGPLALAAPLFAAGHLALVAVWPARPNDGGARDPEPWMTELYAHALPELADTIALASSGDRDLRDVEAALELASSLAAPEPKLRRAVEGLGEALRWGVPSPQALARAEDRLNRAAEALGVPFFVDVQLGALSPAHPLRERAHVLAYRTVRVRTTETDGQVVRAWWIERVDGGIVIEQRLGWTRPGRAECSIILDVVRRRVADELAPARERCELDPWSEPCAAPPASAQDQRAFLALAANVEAHEIQHALDRDRLEPPRALRRAMTYHAEPAIAAATGELSAFLAELGRGAAPKSALDDMAAFAARYPDSAEGHAARLAMSVLTREGETRAHLRALPPETLAARAREAYVSLFAKPLPRPELVADRRAPPG